MTPVFLLAAFSMTPPKPVATPFPLSAIQVTGGLFAHANKVCTDYLLEVEPDRLLHSFRIHSGLEAKGKLYGGWEDSGLAGHSLGHYLTACAQEYARSGDKRFKDKVDYIVDELVECQKSRPDGYISAIPNGDEKWAQIRKGEIKSGGFDLNGMWSPWYTHHKVFAGLLDADQLVGNKKALGVAKKFADWAIWETEPLTDEQWEKMLLCEYGGMNDSLAELYARTKEEKYLKLARRFYDHRILDPLRKGEDDLAGKHSNTQIPKLIGLARLYEVTGDPADQKAAAFFWDRVVNHHSYSIGGNSNGEYLGQPDHLADRLSSNTAETCNTYNMLKLTRHLFAWDPQASQMDFYERAYFNHILGSQEPETGMMTYFMPLGTGTHRNYSNKWYDFTCCHGSGMENHTKHGDSAYFHAGGKTLWVNLFMPSTLTWKEAKTKIRQDTEFPVDNRVALTITEGGSNFEMKLRHPIWAKGPIEYRVGGKVAAVSETPGSFVSIKRAWKKGDKLEFQLPMSLYEIPMPDNAKRVSLAYGPIVLAADLGKADQPAPRIPVLVTNEKPLDEWLKPVPGHPLTFEVTDAARPYPLRFSAFYQLNHNRYGVYFDKFTQSEWDVAEAEYRAEEARQKDLEARTVDQATIGEMQPERDHKLESEKNDVRDVNGRNFRTPLSGGWFEFEMKVDGAKPNTLVLTYWGNDRIRPDAQILVDGKELALETLEGRPANKFFDVEYAIPTELTSGKSVIKIRVDARDGKSGPSVAGARIVRAK